MEAGPLNLAGPTGGGTAIAPNDPRLARCGFAKLQGDGIEFFVRKYEITVGRTSKNSTLDLILGDSTTISRQHATIRYNFDNKCFELVVLGKNGVQVESCGNGATHLYTPDSPPTPLRSRDLLIMGEKRFYFLMPRAMGGQSRKRRRVEPSPAPGITSSGAPAAGVPATAAAAAPVDQQQVQAPADVTEQPTAGLESQQASQQQPVQAPTGAAAAAPLGPAGGVPVPVPAPAPVHSLAHPHEYPHLEAHGPGPAVGGPSGLHHYQNQQDDDDALINAGSLPYDNGAAFGYGAGNNGFPGGF